MSIVNRVPIISKAELMNKSEIILPVIDVITELIYEKILRKEKKDSIESSNKKLIEMEEKLETALSELETIFENSQVGIMSLSGGRYLSRGNKRLAEILGWESPEEMKNINMRRLHLSEERFLEFGTKYFDQLAHGEQIHIEYELAKKDQSPIWCILSGKAVDRSTPADLKQGVIWIIDDISKRKELELKLKHLATTDPLTGLNNRRKFDVMFRREFDRVSRYYSTFSIMLIDLDMFKVINDAYGHKAGDAVLIHFSELLKNLTRDVDITSRVGGEEFAVILPDTEKRNAFLAAERIRENTAASTVHHEDTAIRYTISMGITEFSKGLTTDSMYSQADQAMYKAKNAGRNRVIIYTD